jgi:predicted NAD-dependent protein-ADP-ribosyltransferase YbiA (DUF1768 family)
MVVSQIVDTLQYSENKNIEKYDNDNEVSLYKIKLYDTNVLIALGKQNNKYKKYDIIYAPVYLVLDEKDNIFQIGVYEFLNSEKKKYLDDEGDIDITLLEGPLLYKYVTGNFIKNIMENVELIEDIDETKEDETKEEVEEKFNDIELKRLDDDDDDDRIMETDKNIRKIQNNYTYNSTDNWINKYLKNSKFKIKNNEGGGDCLFATIRDAFNSIGISISVNQLRNKLANNIPDKTYETYKENYDLLINQLNKSKENLNNISVKGKSISKLYLDLKKLLKSKEYKKDDKYQEKKIKLKEVKKYKTELETLQKNKAEELKDIENTETILIDFEFMKNIDSISKFREYVKTSNYWADSAAISLLEEIYNFKIIILESNNYHNGDYSKILQCGDMTSNTIEKKGFFKPYYYIAVEHSGDQNNTHYQLICYGNKSIYRFHDIPYNIREMVKNACMTSKGKSLYNYIPKFRKYIGKPMNIKDEDKEDKKEEKEEKDEDKEDKKDDENIEEPELSPSPLKYDNELYNNDIVFQFYSKSRDKKPGKGSGEKIPDNLIDNFKELNKIKDWRKMLSNFYIAPFTLDTHNKEILKWSSVEHYYQANKYKTTPKLYYLFTMNSDSELSKDAKLAQKAGRKGKTADKYRKELGFDSPPLDTTFFKNKNNEKIMENAQRAKYKQNKPLSNMLKLTNNAKLAHYSRGKEPIVFYDTMRIRKELEKN